MEFTIPLYDLRNLIPDSLPVDKEQVPCFLRDMADYEPLKSYILSFMGREVPLGDLLINGFSTTETIADAIIYYGKQYFRENLSTAGMVRVEKSSDLFNILKGYGVYPKLEDLDSYYYLDNYEFDSALAYYLTEFCESNGEEI